LFVLVPVNGSGAIWLKVPAVVRANGQSCIEVHVDAGKALTRKQVALLKKHSVPVEKVIDVGEPFALSGVVKVGMGPTLHVAFVALSERAGSPRPFVGSAFAPAGIPALAASGIPDLSAYAGTICVRMVPKSQNVELFLVPQHASQPGVLMASPLRLYVSDGTLRWVLRRMKPLAQ
jgi:hypothetical protein